VKFVEMEMKKVLSSSAEVTLWFDPNAKTVLCLMQGHLSIKLPGM
jgi:hypothetical protein